MEAEGRDRHAWLIQEDTEKNERCCKNFHLLFSSFLFFCGSLEIVGFQVFPLSGGGGRKEKGGVGRGNSSLPFSGIERQLD